MRRKDLTEDQEAFIGEMFPILDKFSAMLAERVTHPKVSLAEKLRILDLMLAMVAYMDFRMGVKQVQVIALPSGKRLN